MDIQRFETGALGTNSYLVSDETGEAFLVDAGGYDEAITRTIEDGGLTLKYLVLTHGHADHIGGVARYRERFPDCRVAAAKAEYDILSTPGMNYSMEIFGKDVVVTPDVPLADGDRLRVGNMDVEVIATPGHSPGGVSLSAGGALFSGDTLFHGSIGRTDLTGGSLPTLVASIRERLFALPDETTVYPGHMDETNIGYERRNNPFLK